MALSAAELNTLRLAILEKGGIFSGSIPSNKDEVTKYLSNKEGLEQVRDFIEALAKNRDGLADIPNIHAYKDEIIIPVLEAQAQAKETTHAERARANSEAEIEARKQAKPLKEQIENIIDRAKEVKRASSDVAAALNEEKENLKKQVSDLARREREEWAKRRAADLEELSANFMEIGRQAGIGSAKVAADVVAKFDQFGANCKYYANAFATMVKRAAEDAPHVWKQMKDDINKSLSSMLKEAGKFLHEVKKALDPQRSFHHLDQKVMPLLIQKLELIGKAVEEDNKEARQAIMNQPIKAKEAEAEAARLAAIKKEKEAFRAKHLDELKTEAIKAARLREDKEALKESIVYDKTFNTVVTKLRSTEVGKAKDAKAVATQAVPGKEGSKELGK